MMLSRRTLLKLAGIPALGPFSTVWAEDKVFKHATSFFGPTKYPPGFAHFDYVNPDAPKGGILRLAALGSYDSFNPYIVRGEGAAGLAFTIEALTTQSDDEVAVEYGLIAEAMYYPSDYSSATFQLRKEAQWHDGEPITPDDVIFGFEVLKKTNPLYQFYYKNVAKVEKSGPNEVTFVFDAAGNRELPQIIGQMTPIPKHYWEGKDAKATPRNVENTTSEPPLGCGPYKISKFSIGQSVTLERVKNHWAENLGVRKGTYNFDFIEFLYFRDRSIEFQAFKGDQIDVRLGPGTVEWETQYDFAAVKKGLIVKESFFTKNAKPMQGFAFNLRRAKFADWRVRKAFNLAYDFEGQMRVLSHGDYNKRTQSYFANSELAATGLPQGRELEILEQFRGKIPDEVFAQEYINPVNGTPQNIRKNLREALDLFKQAGWSLNGQKLVNDKGEQMKVEFLLDDPNFEDVVLFYKPNLEKLGMEITIRTIDSSQYQNRIINFDFDIITYVWAQSLSPGNEQREYWGSAAADRPGSRNTVGIKNPAIDAIIELVIFAKTREEQIAATKALDRVLLWNYYVVSQFYRAPTWLPHWDRFGHPEKNADYGIGFPDTWWYDEEKAKHVAATK